MRMSDVYWDGSYFGVIQFTARKLSDEPPGFG